MRSLGADPKLRMNTSGASFVTDNGNYIYDCHFKGGLKNATEFEAKLKGRAGVVETGLFLGMAAVAIVGSESGVRELKR